MFDVRIPARRTPAFAQLRRGTPNSDLRTPKFGQHRDGLTLVEVLLALAILGIGIFVMIATASKCLAVAKQSKNYEKARDLLGRVELEFPLKKDEMEEGSENGSFSGSADYAYKWQRTVAKEGEEEDGLYSVSTRVIWSDRGQEAYEEVVTYLYAPKEVEGGTVEGPAR